MDETWLYHYDPVTKQKSMEWGYSRSPRPTPKNSECKNLLERFLPRFFGMAQDSIPPIIFQRSKLSTRSITHLCWCWQLKDILKEEHRGKVTKGVLFLHDKTPAHQALATQKKLAYLGFQYLDHPPYSLDLTPLDYHLFPELKNN